MYLLPALSQSYRFDIEAVREITKGTKKTAYPSDQSGTSSRVQWMRAHTGWQGVSHRRKTALRAAKPEVNCAGKRSGEHSHWGQPQSGHSALLSFQGPSPTGEKFGNRKAQTV